MTPTHAHVFQGTGVALATPMAADGTLDLAALTRLVAHVLSGGVEVLVPLGTTGESVTLTEAEREAVLDSVFEVNAGRARVLIGCGGPDTRSLQQSLMHYQRRYPQADGFLSVTPYYNRPSAEGLYAHYAALASVCQKPMVLYNVPARTGTHMQAETVLRLAQDFPQIVAVKEASGGLETGMRIVAGQPAGFATLAGDDSLALAGIACGFQGVISVIANLVPGPFCQMVQAALRGDMALAREQHYRLLPLMQALFAEGNPAGIKAALSILGMGSGATRLPLVQASEGLRQHLQDLMAPFGMTSVR